MKSFKQFLIESGFPFATVLDDKKEDIFGHEDKDFVKTPKRKKLSNEDKKKSKLNRFIQYTALNADDE